ncbi:hypothetical protein NWP96_01980 [Mycoplasmopsis cynos]|nr:hypothetical protein [Mycoplasmopsis cynos]
MTVVKFWDVESNQTPENSKALSYFVACCDASVSLKEDGWIYRSRHDPTETGILTYGLQNYNSADIFYSYHTKLDSIPFDSDRKVMSVLVKTNENKNLIIVKGAPDVVFSRSH